MTTIFKTNITNIKLITHVSPPSSSENLATKILSKLYPFIQNLPEKSRVRLYPYFIHDSTKTGSKKHLSQKDTTTLRILTPAIVQFNNALTNYITTYNITFSEKKTPSLLRSIVHFGESLSDKINKLSDSPVMDTTGFNQIIESVIEKVESSSSCILIPAFDSKVINTKQIPDFLLDEKDFTVILVNIESDNILLSKPTKNLKTKKAKLYHYYETLI